MSDDNELYLYSVTDAALRSVAAQRKRAEQAEAAIQRVRERAEGPIPAVHGDWMGGYAAALRDICQALEGDSEQ